MSRRPAPPRSRPGKTRPAARPKQEPTLELDVSHQDADGIGHARHEGREVLIAGAFAGERVRVAVEHAGRNHLTARLLKVLIPHPDRITGACARADQCLGCSLVRLDYAAQLSFKQERVKSALAAHPPLARVEPSPIWGAPSPLAYRTSVKLAFARSRGRIQIGLYRRGTHEVVDTAGCPIHHPLINQIVDVVREEVERQGIWVYDAERDGGLLRYLLVRVSPSRGEAMVTFVTAERNFRELTHLAKWLRRKIPAVVSVQQNVNRSEGNVILGRDTLKLLGRSALHDQVGETRLAISPTSFFQVNHDQAARIYALVRSWAQLQKDESALDLYCGIGGIALTLARDAGGVTGVEWLEEAVRNARENARLNHLRNTRFLAGDTLEVLQDLTLERHPQVVVVNPPRKGCDEEALDALSDLRPRTLIYVSCNPDTLARDLAHLAKRDWIVSALQPVDMFPQTPHVEVVVRLEQAPAARGRKEQRRP